LALLMFDVYKLPVYVDEIAEGVKNELLPSGRELKEVQTLSGHLYVVGLGDGFVAASSINKGEAIEEMKAFIKAAQFALTQLRDLE
jgi:hypothetical protein